MEGAPAEKGAEKPRLLRCPKFADGNHPPCRGPRIHPRDGPANAVEHGLPSTLRLRWTGGTETLCPRNAGSGHSGCNHAQAWRSGHSHEALGDAPGLAACLHQRLFSGCHSSSGCGCESALICRSPTAQQHWGAWCARRWIATAQDGVRPNRSKSRLGAGASGLPCPCLTAFATSPSKTVGSFV